MSFYKRISAALIVLAAAALSLVAAPAAADAAPYTNQIVCTVSTSTPAVGAEITISCTGFGAHIVVHIKLHTQTYNLGEATTDGSGAFSRSVTLPDGVSGQHTLTVNDASGNTGSVPINIGGSGTGGTGTGGGGGTSVTGVAVLSIGGLGVVLLAAGGLLLLSGRRRKVIA